MWSLRGTLGKRLGPVGTSVGAGYDWMAADVDMSICCRDHGVLAIYDPVELPDRRLDTGRWTAFAGADVSLWHLAVSGELGWQEGGEVQGGGVEAEVYGASSLYGGVALEVPFSRLRFW